MCHPFKNTHYTCWAEWNTAARAAGSICFINLEHNSYSVLSIKVNSQYLNISIKGKRNNPEAMSLSVGTHFTLCSSPVYFTIFCLISVTCLTILQTVTPHHGGTFWIRTKLKNWRRKLKWHCKSLLKKRKINVGIYSYMYLKKKK